MRTWVNCPICGEPDMSKTPDDDGFIINCVNLACASNGGDNRSVVLTDLLARVMELEADNAQLQKRHGVYARQDSDHSAQAMAYESLLMKYKELESTLSAHKAALTEARSLLVNKESFSDALLPTERKQ